jgi:hypothetical protein
MRVQGDLTFAAGRAAACEVLKSTTAAAGGFAARQVIEPNASWILVDCCRP